MIELKCFLPKLFLFSKELVCLKLFSYIAQTKHQSLVYLTVNIYFITVLKPGQLKQECQLV